MNPLDPRPSLGACNAAAGLGLAASNWQRAPRPPVRMAAAPLVSPSAAHHTLAPQGVAPVPARAGLAAMPASARPADRPTGPSAVSDAAAAVRVSVRGPGPQPAAAGRAQGGSAAAVAIGVGPGPDVGGVRVAAPGTGPAVHPVARPAAGSAAMSASSARASAPVAGGLAFPAPGGTDGLRSSHRASAGMAGAGRPALSDTPTPGGHAAPATTWLAAEPPAPWAARAPRPWPQDDAAHLAHPADGTDRTDRAAAAGARAPDAPPARAPRASQQAAGRTARAGSREVVFEFIGQGALSVLSSITGRCYRFEQPGARLVVDNRDVGQLARVSLLRCLQPAA